MVSNSARGASPVDNYVNYHHLSKPSGNILKYNFPLKNALMLEPQKLDPLGYKWSRDWNMLCSTTVPE